MGPLAHANAGFPPTTSCRQDVLGRQGKRQSPLETDTVGRRAGSSGEEGGGRGTQEEQGPGGTQDAGAASGTEGPSAGGGSRRGRVGSTSWVESVLGPSGTGTHGRGVGRRRQVRDSGSQAQWGSRARTQSTQLS